MKKIVTLLLGCVLLSGCDSKPKLPTDENSFRSYFLQIILNAYDDRGSSEALKMHGPITEADVPELVEASTNWSSKKRRNAAHLLLILRSDNADQLRLKFITETKDVDAWAVMVGGFRVLELHPDWAGKRPDLIKKGLESSDMKTLAAAIRAGAISKYPGIEAVVEKLMDSPDAKIREACLSSLTPEMAIRVQPRLKQMMRELKKQLRPDSSDYREMLVMNLLSTGDPEIRKEIRDYYEDGEDHGRLELGSMLNIHTDAWIDDYLWELWQTPDKHINEPKYLYPIQFGALSTAIWHIAEKKNFDVRPRWVRACVDVDRMPVHQGSAIDEDCAKLAYFVSGKKHSREWLDDKRWTVRTLETWLKAHPK